MIEPTRPSTPDTDRDGGRRSFLAGAAALASGATLGAATQLSESAAAAASTSSSSRTGVKVLRTPSIKIRDLPVSAGDPTAGGRRVRCIAPDLVGSGESDKLADSFAYTYQRHIDWLRRTLFECHDWGGGLSLSLLGEHPERFRVW